MALIECPECSQQVSDQAASCPNCGHPVKVAPEPKPTPATGHLPECGIFNDGPCECGLVPPEGVLANRGRGGLRKAAVWLAVIVAGVLIFNMYGSNDDGIPQTFTSIASELDGGSGSTSRLPSAASYVNEYGGVRASYQEILDLTDCKKLQDKFDIAAANNDRETPGTSLYRVTIGYMTAADEAMEARGCYD